MMEKIFISVEKSSRMVGLTKKYIGNDLENLQQELVFKFTDEFVNGSARLEYKVGNNKYHIPMTKDGETYTVPIKNVITKEGRIPMQLVIVQTAQDEEIPVFKSNVFDMYCNESINAQEEVPDDYEYWLDVIQTKLADIDDALDQVDNLDIDATKIGKVATVSITNKDGITKSVEITDGTDGEKGETGPANTLVIGTVVKGDEANASITGDAPNQTLNLVLPKGDKGDKGDKGNTGATGPANTLSIGTVTKGENASATITGTAPNQTLNLVLPKGDKGDKGNTGDPGSTGQDGYSPTASVSKSGTTATITITDKNGTTTASISDGEEYDDTEVRGLIAGKQDELVSGTNIKTINNSSILGSGNITITGGASDYTDLTNKPSINSVTLSGNKTSSDLGIQPTIDSSHKLSADLISDGTTNKTVTSTEKSTWNGKYSKPSGGIPSTDLSSAVQTSLGKADTALQSETYTGTITSVKMNGSTVATSGEADLGTVITSHQDISGKQNITDNTLTTTNKTVPTAINEVNSIAKGANQALSYSNYSAMVTSFNSLTSTAYNVGQNVMIVTLEVPDLWISSVESTSSTYTYVDDATIVSALQTNGYIQVGYYKLSMLETQKVDLTNYVTKTSYASGTTGGVIKTLNAFAIGTGNAGDVVGGLYAAQKTNAEYEAMSSLAFVGKGTLENVLTARSYETTSNKTTTISSSSTNTEYPSALAVYNYIQSLDASEVSY